MSYWLVDHRAPAYFPKRRDPLFADAAVVLPAVGLGIAAATLAGLAIGFGGWLLIGFAVLSVVLFVHWLRLICKYVVRIPDADCRMKDRAVQVRDAYWRHPELREVIEPALVAVYDKARQGDEKAVAERAKLVVDVVGDSMRGAVRNDADLQALRQFLEVRAEMRRDGLL